MNTWLIVSLLVALGIIVGNIMLLKYSAKMKFEKPNKESEQITSTPPTKESDKDNHQDPS